MSSRGDPDPQRLIAAHERANEFYRSHLLDEPRALAYLRSRGIIAATAHSAPWTIGYAPRGWTVLREHLRAAGFTDAELLAAGLATTARNGNLIDVFRDRVMFPIRNSDCRVVAFTGRDLSGRDDTPKYRNTTTTAIYTKKSLLYGLAEQVAAGTPPAAVMLVEGPADVAAVARLRQSLPATVYPDPYIAVAPCGTALTAEQVALLAAAVPPGTPIVVAFDADTAGQAAIDKSYLLLRDWAGPVDAMALPAGSDPAALVASGPATAAAGFSQARTPLVGLVLEHRLAPHLTRLQTRLAELARFDRDPSSESFLLRLDAVHAVAPLISDVAERDPAIAARLAHQLTVRLDLNPLTVFETVFPPAEDPFPVGDPASPPHAPAPPDAGQADTAGRPAVPLGAAGFPDPQAVGHEYARACPTDGPAATWVAHDPATGHSAWVIAEGAGDTAADRDAAALACEVAGRVAVAVGAQQAVRIARTAVNAHFAALDRAAQGNASIAVLTSFDGEQPRAGQGRFTLAWAGDARAYAATGRWFAPLTVAHTLRGRATAADPAAPVRAGDGALTASVRGGPIGVNRIDLAVTQILLTGRAVPAADPDRLRQALEGRRPAAALAQLHALAGPSTLALVVRPRPGRALDAVTAARLARQDQAPATAPPAGRRAVRGRARQAALPAAPASPAPAR
ncbi:MAG: primase [Micromonosporaceae bacterium]